MTRSAPGPQQPAVPRPPQQTAGPRHAHAAIAAALKSSVRGIKRSDGTTQAVYNGHPLYTYSADTAPGQAHGNNLNLNGGLWHKVTVSG